MSRLFSLLNVFYTLIKYIYRSLGVMLISIYCLLCISMISNKLFAQQKVVDFSFYENKKLGPILMESTFYIYDPLYPASSGTSFVLAHIMDVDTSSRVADSTYFNVKKTVGSKYLKFDYIEVLVTAAHVFKKMKGDFASIVLRSKINNEYITFDYPIRIRENGKPLWAQIGDVDTAVIVIFLPQQAVYSILMDNYLATDSNLDDINLNAGDDLSCVGFPHSTPSDERYFPILRSGKYASYRGIHTMKENNFLYDFRIYPGNSGGPVFIDFKITTNTKGEIIFNTSVLLGLISVQLKTVDEKNAIEVAKVIKAEHVYKTILSTYSFPSS